MEKENLIIDGFKFERLKDVEEAKKEQKAIDYIRSNTDLSNMTHVTKIYSKLVKDKTFNTIIGYIFLKELQDTIIRNRPKSLEDMDMINVTGGKEPLVTNKTNISVKKYEKEKRKLKAWIGRLLVLNIFFIAVICGMMIIAYITNDSEERADFENEVINSYIYWSDQLKERERQLNQRELELINKEEELKKIN